jgi:hypothetical protein
MDGYKEDMMSERATIDRRKTPLSAPAPPQYQEREAALDPTWEPDAIHRPPRAALVHRALAGHEFSAIAIQPPELQPAAPSDAQIGAEGGALDEATEERIDERRGEGAPLDPATRTRMDRAFATSFADVRIHADGESDTLNRSLSARAFTTGTDLFFQQDAFQPGTHTGDRLLAHELTHVVQQRSAPASGPLTVGAVDDPAEREADAAAEQVAADEPATGIEDASMGQATVAPARVQRQGGDPNATATAPPPSGSVQDKVPSQLDLKSVQGRFTIPEGVALGGSVTGKAYTTDWTDVSVQISEKGVSLHLSPPIHIRPVTAWVNIFPIIGQGIYFGMSDCEWSDLEYSFASASITSVGLKDTGPGSSIQGSVRSTITEKVTALFAGTKVATAGYDPLTDTDVAGTVAGIVANAKTFAPDGGGDLEVKNIHIGGTVAFKSAMKTDQVDLPAGTSATLDVWMDGTAKDVADPAKRKISMINVETSGITLLYGEHHQPVAKVTRASLSNGGAFSVLAWEPLGEGETPGVAAGIVGMVGGMLEGYKEAGEVGGNIGLLVGGGTAKVAGDQWTKQKIEAVVGPIVVQLIRDNRGVISGIDLAALLGL